MELILIFIGKKRTLKERTVKKNDNRKNKKEIFLSNLKAKLPHRKKLRIQLIRGQKKRDFFPMTLRVNAVKPKRNLKETKMTKKNVGFVKIEMKV